MSDFSQALRQKPAHGLLGTDCGVALCLLQIGKEAHYEVGLTPIRMCYSTLEQCVDRANVYTSYRDVFHGRSRLISGSAATSHPDSKGKKIYALEVALGPSVGKVR